MIDIMHEASGAGSRPHSLRGLEIPTPGLDSVRREGLRCAADAWHQMAVIELASVSPIWPRTGAMTKREGA